MVESEHDERLPPACCQISRAYPNGDIVSARKGNGVFTVHVAGRAAHAGVEPERGANAILELARQIEALQAFNGARPDLTVNVGIVRGGTVSNYARYPCTTLATFSSSCKGNGALT